MKISRSCASNAVICAVLVSACSASQPPSPPPVGTQGGAEPQQAFYSYLRPPEGAVLAPEPYSLRECRQLAQIVVLARPATVTTGRTIADVQFVNITLADTEVLYGSMHAPTVPPIRVEFPGTFRPDSIESVRAKLQNSISADRAVWFLKWNGPRPATKPGAGPSDPTADPTSYSTVHPNCGVFAQGSEHVLSATARRDDTQTNQRSAMSEAEKTGRLDQLIANVKR